MFHVEHERACARTNFSLEIERRVPRETSTALDNLLCCRQIYMDLCRLPTNCGSLCTVPVLDSGKSKK